MSEIKKDSLELPIIPVNPEALDAWANQKQKEVRENPQSYDEKAEENKRKNWENLKQK